MKPSLAGLLMGALIGAVIAATNDDPSTIVGQLGLIGFCSAAFWMIGAGIEG